MEIKFPNGNMASRVFMTQLKIYGEGFFVKINND